MEAIEEMSFEASLVALEDIVSKLEEGTLNLEEAMVLYQRGRDLAAHSQELLDTMVLRIQKLTANGSVVTMASDAIKDGA
ncbi:MAG: exodeoxyribonuclease VII small subunit [Anaerolineae bacterium]|nr:exodeoxyribonuclease VII small subunit [Anaerolineae bacterium]